MPTTATVNYHIASSGTQTYYIDAGGETGRIVGPDVVATDIDVIDLRETDVLLAFAHDGLAFVTQASAVQDFDDARTWQDVYDRELRDLLSKQTGAKEAVIFDHTLRIDDPASERKPARNVHSDYSAEGAHQRLKDILGTEIAAEWERAHFAFVNVWRPVRHPVTTAPLGFVLPGSVGPEDWVTIDLVYPHRTGQIMGLAPNPRHEWIYRSAMTPDEVVLFNIYDNRGRPSVAHSALDLKDGPAVETPRMSMESRTLVRY